MRVYNYLDIDDSSMSLAIEDGDTVYEYFEPDRAVLESCEDWTYMDCKNYMRNNDPIDVREKELN